MKAAVVREHGAPDRLNYETDFPDPKPGEGDVIVAVGGLPTSRSLGAGADDWASSVTRSVTV